VKFNDSKDNTPVSSGNLGKVVSEILPFGANLKHKNVLQSVKYYN